MIEAVAFFIRNYGRIDSLFLYPAPAYACRKAAQRFSVNGRYPRRARRDVELTGWLEADDVINTRPLRDLAKILK